MKVVYYIFILVCILAPLIIIPYLANTQDNPYLYFGIAFYVAGVILAALGQEALYFIPVLLIIAYWYFFGVNLYSPPTIFFDCIAGGFIAYRANKNFKKFLTKHFSVPDE